MKLHELDHTSRVDTISKVFESQFGTSLNTSQLTADKARGLLRKVRGIMAEHKTSSSYYTSEQDPRFIKLIMMEQSLEALVTEYGSVGATGSSPASAAPAVDMNNPKTKMAMQKASRGQTLTPDEQKTMNAIALMQKEAKKQKRMVKEDEMQQAQVVLAGQDLIDRIQKMIEDTSAMQFKDLPALVDSVRSDMGADEAAAYESSANGALSALLSSLQTAKADMESAQGTLTGQGEMVVPGAEDDVEVDTDLDSIDVDVDDEEIDGEEQIDIEVDDEDTAVLGREKR